jgi:hypothetical protein
MIEARVAANDVSVASVHQGPNIVFLGLCERAAHVREGNTQLFKWNVIGLKNIILSHIFPLGFSGLSVGFALSTATACHDHKFRITDESGREIGQINLSTMVAAPSDEDAVLRNQGCMVSLPQHGWVTAFTPLNGTQMVIPAPGTYHLRHVTDCGEHIVGELLFAAIDAAPLTQERIAAIRTDPNATKAIRMELGCKECPAKCRAYAALDRNRGSEADGWCWYQALPDKFVCDCGKTNLSLDTLRQNLHGLLGQRYQDTADLEFVPLYERSSLETIRTSFATLLAASPREELLQQFLAENPILFHQFPSQRLISKPPILTSFVADFALVTPQRELLLVELEKSTTRLMRQDGGVASELSHAFDQVNDWLHVADEHRLAVLDSLQIAKEDVSMVRGIVIAGRDLGYDAHKLRKLKGVDRGRITFLTYDDLFFALDALIKRIGAL